MKIEYAVQPSPDGLAQAFLIGREFLDGASSCLVLGDNIFHGHGLTEVLQRASAQETGATVFGYFVRDPERYGVAEFDATGKVVGLEGKAVETAFELRRHRPVFLRRAGAGVRRAAAALATRRAGNHRPQPLLPRGRQPATRAPGPRLRLAGYRYPRIAGRGFHVRGDDREAAGPARRSEEHTSEL